MKTVQPFAVLGTMAVLAAAAHGQDFINLNFEAATNLPPPGHSVAVSNALPGWSAFVLTNQQQFIAYDPPSYLPSPVGAILIGSNSSALDGNFSVALAHGSISQMGLVPTNAESLLFDAVIFQSPLTVSLNGQNLSYVAISNALNSYGYSYTIYGADISAFAGQSVPLVFSGVGVELDNIQFSDQLIQIPEPGELGLWVLGALALGFPRRRKQLWR